ncbi:MAG: patatin-like phospholipase family protein [Pseudomonadota bacterium]|nr:patatin-like phospholipase family protein [Pseudomonadota bacterium]
MPDLPKIGLALSGGGSRAIAFHLGCMRALHDRGVLAKVSVLSAVSGGSVIAALYAYSDEPFPEFEARVLKLLRKGLAWGIARQTLASPETFKIAAALLSAGMAALAGAGFGLLVRLLGFLRLSSPRLTTMASTLSAPLPRFASRVTAFERHLKTLYGECRVDQVRRADLHVVLNAAELRTGTAFRFGSLESGCWRYGRLVVTPTVARAVAASAAFPALLPSFDEYLAFERGGKEDRHRVIVTDGGVYDNLGITCMLPGRQAEFSTNAHDVDFIIACDAGQGMPSGTAKPYLWSSRMLATVDTIHRRTNSLSYNLLHRMAENGELKGFLLPYLGQIDERLPYHPPDLVPRSATVDYPTNFSPMSGPALENLSRRGEQLTLLLLDSYAPDL